MTEDEFEFREGRVSCKCGWEMVPDSDSKQYSHHMRCPNPDCTVQVVTMVRPNPRKGEDMVRFRDVKICVVTT